MPTPGEHSASAGQVPTDQFLAHQMRVPIPAAGHSHPPRASVSRRLTGSCASPHDASPQRPPVDGAEEREHAGTTVAPAIAGARAPALAVGALAWAVRGPAFATHCAR